MLLPLVAYAVTQIREVKQEETYNEQFVYEQVLSPREYLRTLVSGGDFVILDRIIICESGWKPEAKNSHSTASGLFQFLASTWSGWGEGDVFNPYDNIKGGVRLYQAQGTRPWLASESCWKNVISR